MTTRNILCAYNGSNTAVDSLRYAIKIANYHNGWLTGIVRAWTSDHGNTFFSAPSQRGYCVHA